MMSSILKRKGDLCKSKMKIENFDHVKGYLKKGNIKREKLYLFLIHFSFVTESEIVVPLMNALNFNNAIPFPICFN
jgi:hypothetical protein